MSAPNRYYVDEPMLRSHVLDTGASVAVGLPSTFSLGLDFSHDEIVSAMRSAARDYDSIPPFISRTNPDRMPADTNVFLDAAASALFRGKAAALLRNRTPYQAGGVSVDEAGAQGESCMKLCEFFDSRFRKTAADLKLAANIAQFHGKIG